MKRLLIVFLILFSPVYAHDSNSTGPTYISYNYTKIYHYTDEDIEVSKRLGEKLYFTNLSANFWKVRATRCENKTVQEQTVILTTSREEAENLTSDTSFDVVLPLVEVEIPRYIEVPEVKIVEVPSSSNDKLRASNEGLRASSNRLRSAIILLSIFIGIFFVGLLIALSTIQRLNKNLGLLEAPDETVEETEQLIVDMDNTKEKPTFEDYCIFAIQVAPGAYKDFNDAHNDSILKHEFSEKTMGGWGPNDKFFKWWIINYASEISVEQTQEPPLTDKIVEYILNLLDSIKQNKTNIRIKRKGSGGQGL